MLHSFLKLRTWIVFLVLIIPNFLMGLTDDEFYQALYFIIDCAFLMGYYLFVYEICNEKVKSENNLGFYLSILAILSYSGFISIVGERQAELVNVEMTVYGALGILILFIYCAYCVIKMYLAYTGGTKKPDFQNYLKHFALFGFLPLGIWTIHSRLHKEFEQEKLRNFRSPEE